MSAAHPTGKDGVVTNPKRRVTRRSSKRNHVHLGENDNFHTKPMEVFKRKKTAFFPNAGGSAKEMYPAVQKHAANERKVLSDNSNITKGAEYVKKTAPPADCSRFAKTKQTFRATPGNHASRKLRKSKPLYLKKNVCINGPERVVPFDEPMDLDDPALRLRNILKTVPVGVHDIDTDKGELYCPCYAQDITDYLQAVETRWTFPRNYLEDQTDVTPSMRAVLMDWLIQVQCHEHLLDETLHLTVALIDRYICLKVPPLHQLQLLGVTCLLVAAKYEERFPPELSTLCHLTDNTYTEEDVIAMEIEILRRLKFDLNIPGPIVFLDRFLQAEENDAKVPHMCRYLIDLSLVSVGSVQFVPSLLAASAICIARRTFRPLMGAVWTPNLGFYTKYNQHDLHSCIHHLETLLARVPTAKYKAAKNKYNKPEFDCISSNPLVCVK